MLLCEVKTIQCATESNHPCMRCHQSNKISVHHGMRVKWHKLPKGHQAFTTLQDHTCYCQARRQDIAAGGQKPEGGAKNQKGGHILKILYWMYAATRGPNVKWGGTGFKWGAGHHWPPRWRRPWLQ